MIPKRLLISGFLSYYEPVEINFDAFELACISGQNGAGKSSLLDALTWNLFGIARRKDDAIINNRANLAEVEFDFNYEGTIYRIIRKKQRDSKSMLEFLISDNGSGWKPLTEKTIRETEDFISRTLRLDYETFVNASFFLQGKADQFAQQRPGDRKRILTNIMGLEKWDEYRQRVVDKRKTTENTLSGVMGQIGEIEAELSLEAERKTKLKTLKEELDNVKEVVKAEENNLSNARLLFASLEEHRKMVDVLKSQYQTTAKQLEEQRDQIQKRKHEVGELEQNIEQRDLIEAAYKKWQDDFKRMDTLNALADKYHELDMRRSKLTLAIEKEQSLIEQEKIALEKQHQQVMNFEKDAKRFEDLIKGTETKITELNSRIKKKADLETNLAQVESKMVALKSENKYLFDNMQLLKERIEKLQDTKDAECPLCGQSLDVVDRESLLASLKEEGKKEGDSYRKNQELIKEYEKQIQDLNTELQKIKRVEEELRLLEREQDQFGLNQEQVQKYSAEWDADGKNRLQELLTLLKGGKYALEERDKLKAIDLEIQQLGYDPEEYKKIKEAELNGRRSETQLRDLESAKAALEPLNREIEEIHRKIKLTQEELTAQEKAYKEAEEKYNVLQKSLPDLKVLEKQLAENKALENDLRLKVGGANQAVEVLGKIRKRKVILDEERKAILEEISQLKILERAFSKDGVPALLIEQALPEIEMQANDILDRLSAGEMSVHFETLRDYKNKKRQDKRETLDILISSSAGERAYEMFSGGEAFRINFAIRLALSRVLAHRAGARLQTLVIDEGFGSQDTSGRQRLIETINLVRKNFEKILVITHLEDLKDAFPARLEVEKTLSGSRVNLVV